MLVGHDRSSPTWYVWLKQDEKLVKSEHVTLEREEIFELVREMRTVGQEDGDDGDDNSGDGSIGSDEEDDSTEDSKGAHDIQEKKENSINGFTAKRTQSGNGLRRSTRLAQIDPFSPEATE